MIRNIIIKAQYIVDDDLLKSGAIVMTPPSDVKKNLKLDLEEILDAEGYIGMEIIVEDMEDKNKWLIVIIANTVI